MLKLNGVDIEWLGHDGFKIMYTKTIYIDPYKIAPNEPADIILLTHEHYDHCSVEDIKKIVDKDTIIFLVPDCISKISAIKTGKTVLVEPGKKYGVGTNIFIETVPAYNVNKFRSEDIPFHPKDDGKVGYIITIGGKRIYHAGDTDFSNEIIAKLTALDVALVPVSGTYVATAEEAAHAVNIFKPKLAVPMHYGAGVAGTIADAERFRALCKVPVEILEKS